LRSRLCNHCKQWNPVHEWQYGCPACGESNHVPKADYRVMPDLKPYKSVVTGELIGGRRQHREHLNRHNLMEIGNEYQMPKRQKKSDVKEDLLKTYHKLRSR
jgi:hypothetical protein